ncbi:dihydrofolate reductase [Emericellopsis atlantica]|uniref:Dihydrofolate reductase n=1 Tax=Emericellopsis atlantica TaxID=2614577 RepID=A0A9P8CTC8_9HYPO|nr:dihydrofolate reductase [Emericellopsis atlantica]KAG9259019.1 dihydrofolate reductase [Emericellopsis atlantica]
MAIDSQLSAGTATPPKAQVPKGKTEVKILMIHGTSVPMPEINTARYTQSGALFRAKTRALEKLLAKVLSPVSLHPTLIYPTGPNRLLPRDIPGFVPKEDGDDDEQGDSWAWFRKDEASGQYRLFDKGMDTIATAIRESGGVDGVVGFSQGGFMAGAVASALEETRAPPEGPDGDWARKLREANGGKGLKFAVPYSGFFAPVESLQWLYEPKIKTPTLHYLGSLDTVVEESRSMGLVDRCEQPVVITHPGGHHVPVSKEWVMPLAGFIKQHAEVKPQAGL